MDESLFQSLRDAIATADAHADDAPALFDPSAHDLAIVDDFETRLAAMQKRIDTAPAKRGPKPKPPDPLLTRTKSNKASRQKLIAVLDFETDPFAHGQFVKPFAWGFFDGKTHTTFWDRFNEPRCIPELIAFLESLDEPHLIYAHNGGKFDYLYLLKYIRKNMLIINGRIVSAFIGKHEIRDSFAALPVPLSGYKKEKFDYDNMAVGVRARHYDQILAYLKSDCEYLHELILAYHAEFGNVKTMAGAAMKEFKKFYTYEKCNENTDAMYRHFYYGGRVECFQGSGVFRQPCSFFDVNSMYPYVMKTELHPICDAGFITTHVTNKTCFLEVTGHNDGAFPMRLKDRSLDFGIPYGRFKVTIHEWYAALETKRFRPVKIHSCHNFFDRCSFGEFVDHFYDARLLAVKNHDEARKLFYKLVPNSCYGKFAQNPRDFKDYEFRGYDEPLPDPLCNCPDNQECICDGWNFELYNPGERWRLWFKKSAKVKTHSFYNIMTAASITGAARALLLRGIVKAVRPVYCDTDSIICEALPTMKIDQTELGAWKLERNKELDRDVIGDSIAVAGKKNYAVFSGDVCLKFATKGSRISPEELVQVAQGEEIVYESKAPSLHLDGSYTFIRRRINRTA